MVRPRFSITPAAATALMSIEADRQAVESLPLTVTVLDSLRRTARLIATHYSTQIEGNRLTAGQVEKVLAGGGPFPGRERDEREVRHYHRAIEYADTVARAGRPMTETVVRTIHGLVEHGRRKPTPYRDGQNVIRDGRTGRIVYLPPEAKDVPRLMKELVAWIRDEEKSRSLPAPVFAALAHYQFATIHPYFDGNGRTARLLTTLLLHRGGYGLRGIYSLEEYYAKHLAGYYAALAIGKSHNYYFGRAGADCSGFVEYFCVGMADSFAHVRRHAEEAGRAGAVDETLRLRELTATQRRVLGLFVKQKTVSSAELGEFLGLKPRNASLLAARWVKDGFLDLADPSRKARRHRLAARYEAIVQPAE
jgi:Fic family protein